MYQATSPPKSINQQNHHPSQAPPVTSVIHLAPIRDPVISQRPRPHAPIQHPLSPSSGLGAATPVVAPFLVMHGRVRATWRCVDAGGDRTFL